jgi:hypothetical protein
MKSFCWDKQENWSYTFLLTVEVNSINSFE